MFCLISGTTARSNSLNSGFGLHFAPVRAATWISLWSPRVVHHAWATMALWPPVPAAGRLGGGCSAEHERTRPGSPFRAAGLSWRPFLPSFCNSLLRSPKDRVLLRSLAQQPAVYSVRYVGQETIETIVDDWAWLMRKNTWAGDVPARRGDPGSRGGWLRHGLP